MKKLLSLLIIIGLMSANTLPASAFFEKKQKKPEVKVLPVVNKFEYINLNWWSKFNDEDLNRYIQMAMDKNYDLKMATLAVEEYYHSIKMQRSKELPSLTTGFLPAYGGSRRLEAFELDSDTALFALPVIVSYEADIFLKNHDKTKSVKKLYEGALIDERAAYISIAAAVGAVYFNIVKLDKLIELQENVVDCRKLIYDLMMLSHEEGIVSTFETVRTNKAYIIGNSELIELKRQRIMLLNQLAVLIGESPENIDSFTRISYDKLNYAGEIPTEISSEIITNRPDYLKSEKMLEKAGVDVRIAKKEFLPSIPIVGSVFFNSSNLGSLFTTTNALWSIAGGALISLYSGGAKTANLKKKKAEYERMFMNYQKTNLTAIQEVNDTLVSLKSDNEKLSDNLKNQKLEEKNLKLTKLKYDEGVSSKLDLTQVQESYLTVNQRVVSNKINCFIDYVNVYKASGAALK